MASITITNGYPSSWDWIPVHFPDDWNADDGGTKKYLYTQDGSSATWVINPSWKAGELSAVIRMIDDWDTKSDADIKAELDADHFFDPMDINTFLGAALQGGLDGDRVREAMDNDGYVTRLTNILERGDVSDLDSVIDYQPASVLLTAQDKTDLKAIVSRNSLADALYKQINSTAPGTITEADILAAR